jgi:ABC-type uncharacterized transport system YnjBCD ATPase subunit
MSIELKNVSVAYDDQRSAIHNVSLRVESRDTVALLGPSGAGKTTLLRVISGVLTPAQSDDTVEVSGEIAVNGAPPDQRFRQSGQLAFLFQGPSLLPNLNVLKNVSLPLQLLGRPSNGEEETWLESFGLLSERDKLPKQFSVCRTASCALTSSPIPEDALGNVPTSLRFGEACQAVTFCPFRTFGLGSLCSQMGGPVFLPGSRKRELRKLQAGPEVGQNRNHGCGGLKARECQPGPRSYESRFQRSEWFLGRRTQGCRPGLV